MDGHATADLVNVLVRAGTAPAEALEMAKAVAAGCDHDDATTRTLARIVMVLAASADQQFERVHVLGLRVEHLENVTRRCKE